MKLKKTTDLSLTLTVFLMIILMIIIIYWFATTKEKYAVAPVFEFAGNQWYTPIKGNYISRYNLWNVTDVNMTIAFDLHIVEFQPWWRNIFRFLMPYEDWWEDGTKFGGYDYYRRAGIFIIPDEDFFQYQRNGLHITFDTASSSNNAINIPLPQDKKPHNIGCVWQKENTVHTLTVFVDFVQQGKYYYNNLLIPPDPDALFYCADSMYGSEGFLLRNLKVFNSPLSLPEYKDAVPRLA